MMQMNCLAHVLHLSGNAHLDSQKVGREVKNGDVSDLSQASDT